MPMYEIEFTPEALEDLESFRKYDQKKNDLPREGISLKGNLPLLLPKTYKKQKQVLMYQKPISHIHIARKNPSL